MEKHWIYKQPDDASVAALSAAMDISPLVAALLCGRDMCSQSDANRFLAPSLADMLDPFLMAGMERAVARLLDARRTGEQICIYGDYDVDGITATTLMVSFLGSAGFTCTYFIPHRIDDGYGLNADALRAIAARGATLIVSVDCGITSLDEALLCRELGLDLIVTDHHMPRATIPEARAVLNPLQPGCGYPFKQLAGVGVAFNLLVALRASMRNIGLFAQGDEPDLRECLDLVALGTIADVVPLIGQNRLYVYHGLRQLTRSVKPGIVSLKAVSGVKGDVSCGQVGFRLAPRLNAAGRLESALAGVELFLSPNADETDRIASELDAANGERQTIERSIFEEAVKRVLDSGDIRDRRSIVLASETWHQGVVGIVSSRLVERFHRPTILIALGDDGMGKGSGRSIPGFHLLEALGACAANLTRFGGHRYAAGISLRAADVDLFAQEFEQEARLRLGDDDLTPLLQIDAVAEPDQITIGLAHELKRLEPFGAGNPEPTFVMRGVKVVDRREMGEGHLRLRLMRNGHYFQAVGFRMATRETEGELDIAFCPVINTWNGSDSLQLRIKDIKKTE